MLFHFRKKPWTIGLQSLPCSCLYLVTFGLKTALNDLLFNRPLSPEKLYCNNKCYHSSPFKSDESKILHIFDLDLCDLCEGQRSRDLNQIISPEYLYNTVKQSSLYLFICFEHGWWFKIHLYISCDLENAPVDLEINRLHLWPIYYYGT